MKKYITTPIYYTNGAPHIGHAYTTILADVFKKFEQMKGNEVFFSTGTDEHGQKNQHTCEASGLPIDEFLEKQSALFKNLFNRMDINYDYFVRTSSKEHKKVVRRVLMDLYNRGLIIKKSYEGLYCEGCEQLKRLLIWMKMGCVLIIKKPRKLSLKRTIFSVWNPIVNG